MSIFWRSRLPSKIEGGVSIRERPIAVHKGSPKPGLVERRFQALRCDDVLFDGEFLPLVNARYCADAL
jgi:hypothetical protein